MKKLLTVLFLTLVFPAVCIADFDLSGMSYDELVELSKSVGRTMMQHDDFESVRVPRGIWEVGVDIPEGVWILSSADGGFVNVVYGNTLDKSGNDMNPYTSGNTDEDMEDSEVWRVNAVSGNYFCIEYGDVMFTSDTGSAGLGFKKK